VLGPPVVRWGDALWEGVEKTRSGARMSQCWVPARVRTPRAA